MPITEKNIKKHELIGMDVEILSKNENINKMHGRIIDETKNLIIIEANGKEKKILKKGNKFKIILKNKKETIIKGEEVLGRPWERLKK